MSAPKTIGIILLSIILFFTLCVFGVVFTVKMTALNASYVTSLVDDIPVTEIIEEAAAEGEVDNPELFTMIKEVVTENETAIKDRIGDFVQIVYKYLNGKSDSLDMAQALKDTVLAPDFIVSMINNTDLTPLLEEFISGMLEGDGSPLGLSYNDYEQYIDDMAADIEPLLKEQAAIIISPVYDYIMGKSQAIDVTISLQDFKEVLNHYLKQAFLASPPAEYKNLSRAELEQAFENLFEDFTKDLSSSINIDEEFFTSEDGATVTVDLTEAEQALSESREYVGIFNLVFYLLIIFILLLIGGIILIYREVKGSALNLGLVSLIYGVGVLLTHMGSTRIARDVIMQQDISSSVAIRDWLIQRSTGSLFPLQILYIVFILIGIVLLAVYFVYRRRQNAI
ncbi:MAG: hypothetical protein PHE15_06390 [Dehalococcoidales bacterium]|nr:hypothetical protein [Dehalococcoidales bacterium]